MDFEERGLLHWRRRSDRLRVGIFLAAETGKTEFGYQYQSMDYLQLRASEVGQNLLTRNVVPCPRSACPRWRVGVDAGAPGRVVDEQPHLCSNIHLTSPSFNTVFRRRPPPIKLAPFRMGQWPLALLPVRSSSLPLLYIFFPTPFARPCRNRVARIPSSKQPEALHRSSSRSMATRKGLLPVTPASLAPPELTQHLGDIAQDATPNLTNIDQRSGGDRIKAIRNGLLRFLGIPPPCSPTDSVTRFVPTSSVCSSSSSSRASSRSRDELRADMRRVVPPAELPSTSHQIASGMPWPKGNNLFHPPSTGHSRSSSDASKSTQLSLTLATVPELSPSKSESRFDTTSTRKHVSFAPTSAEAKKPERALYGPLEVDSDCFSFGSDSFSSDSFNRAPDVTAVETTRQDPLLFSNIINKTDAVFTGEPITLNHPVEIHGCGFEPVHVPSSLEIRERKAREQKRKLEERKKWLKLQEHRRAQAALREQYAIANQWRDENRTIAGVKTPPGFPSRQGNQFAPQHQSLAIEEGSFMKQRIVVDECKSLRYASTTCPADQQCPLTLGPSNLTILTRGPNSDSASGSSEHSWETCSCSASPPAIPINAVRKPGICLPAPDSRNHIGRDDGQRGNNPTSPDYIVRDVPVHNNALGITCDEQYDHENSCAIESCSTVGFSGGGRRYF